MINCKKAQDMISLFIDEQLNDDEREDFLKHIETCKKCRIEKEEMEYIVQMCKDIGEEELPSCFKESLRAKLQEEAANRINITELSEKSVNANDTGAANTSKDKNIKDSYIKKYVRIFASIAAVMIMFVLIKGFYPQLLNPASYRMKDSAKNSLAFENNSDLVAGSKTEIDKNTSNRALKSDGNAELPEKGSDSAVSLTTSSSSRANQESSQSSESMLRQALNDDINNTEKEKERGSLYSTFSREDRLMEYADGFEVDGVSENSMAAQDDRSSGYGVTALMDPKSVIHEVDPESLYASEGDFVDQLEINMYSSDINEEVKIIRGLISEMVIEEYTDEMYNVPAAKFDSSNTAVINIMVPETRFKEFISIIDSRYSREDLKFSQMERRDVEDILNEYDKRISEIDERLNELEQQNGESIEKNNLKIERNSIVENSNKIRISTLYVFVNIYVHQK